jgi:hypothetical protein
MWETDRVSRGWCRSQLAQNLDLEISQPFEPVFGRGYGSVQFYL